MKKTWILLSTLCLIAIACNKDKEDDLVEEFNKKAMLTNYADAVIQPRYERLSTNLEVLQSKLDSFKIATTSQNLNKLKEAYNKTYKSWQAVSYFEFGPAENYALKATFNLFPVDTNRINQNITSGNYVLGSASNISAIGLPAIDFLLNRGSSESETLSYYNGTHSNKHKQYLQDIVTQLTSSLSTVANKWNGNYSNSFKNADGTSQGSSVSNMINALNLDFEKFIRDGKVGIPLGIRSLGTPQPEKSESFFGKKSRLLLRESIAGLQSYFNGGNGIGFDDYLNHLDAKHGSQLLSTKINNQFNAILEKIDGLTNPIDMAVTVNKTVVQEVYNEMQKMVVLLKVDLSSALSVLITYQDNDGD